MLSFEQQEGFSVHQECNMWRRSEEAEKRNTTGEEWKGIGICAGESRTAWRAAQVNLRLPIRFSVAFNNLKADTLGKDIDSRSNFLKDIFPLSNQMKKAPTTSLVLLGANLYAWDTFKMHFKQ